MIHHIDLKVTPACWCVSCSSFSFSRSLGNRCHVWCLSFILCKRGFIHKRWRATNCPRVLFTCRRHITLARYEHVISICHQKLSSSVMQYPLPHILTHATSDNTMPSTSAPMSCSPSAHSASTEEATGFLADLSHLTVYRTWIGCT